MYNMTAQIATTDIKIPKTRQITLKNLDGVMFALAAEVTVANIIKPYDRTLTIKERDLPKEVLSTIKSLQSACERILTGLPFTATVEDNPYGGTKIGTFAVRSASRPEIIYATSENSCQCEGYSNHGNCWHRLAFKVFLNYAKLIRANENLMTEYAKLGIELKPQVRPRDILNTPDSGIFEIRNEADLKRALDELLRKV